MHNLVLKKLEPDVSTKKYFDIDNIEHCLKMDYFSTTIKVAPKLLTINNIRNRRKSELSRNPQYCYFSFIFFAVLDLTNK